MMKIFISGRMLNLHEANIKVITTITNKRDTM